MPESGQQQSTDGAKRNTKSEAKPSSTDFSNTSGQDIFTMMNDNGFGRLGASVAIPSIEAGLSFLQDARKFAGACTAEIEQNMKAAESDWKRLSDCENGEDYVRTLSEIGQSSASRLAESGSNMVALSTEISGRYFQTMSNLVSAATQRPEKR